jgi:hypothetical protein
MDVKRRLIGLLGCSLMALTFSAYAADKPKEPIKTVALIEARELPVEFDITFGFWRHFVPFGVAGAANSNGSAFIAQAMPKFRAEKYDPSGILNRTVIKGLEDAGIKVSIIKDIDRSESKPNNIKYPAVKHDSDALMQLAINYYIFVLPKGQQVFWPQVDSWVSVYDKLGKTETLGAAASHSWEYKVGQDPGYFNVPKEMSFASEEAMVENPKKFADVFNQIMTTQAEHIVRELLSKWPK